MSSWTNERYSSRHASRGIVDRAQRRQRTPRALPRRAVPRRARRALGPPRSSTAAGRRVVSAAQSAPAIAAPSTIASAASRMTPSSSGVRRRRLRSRTPRALAQALPPHRMPRPPSAHARRVRPGTNTSSTTIEHEQRGHDGARLSQQHESQQRGGARHGRRRPRARLSRPLGERDERPDSDQQVAGLAVDVPERLVESAREEQLARRSPRASVPAGRSPNAPIAAVPAPTTTAPSRSFLSSRTRTPNSAA